VSAILQQQCEQRQTLQMLGDPVAAAAEADTSQVFQLSFASGRIRQVHDRFAGQPLVQLPASNALGRVLCAYLQQVCQVTSLPREALWWGRLLRFNPGYADYLVSLLRGAKTVLVLGAGLGLVALLACNEVGLCGDCLTCRSLFDVVVSRARAVFASSQTLCMRVLWKK
jgi:hypothetical protein